MHIEHPHQLEKQQAIEKIQQLLDEFLKRDLGASTSMIERDMNWNDNVLDFSFKAQQGLLNAAITGKAQVLDRLLILDIEMPTIVTALLGEDRIREKIISHLERLI